MNRFVIVNLLHGEPLKFHEKTVENVCNKFKIQRQKLPGHITLKAPFETENIDEVEAVINEFVKNHTKAPIKLEGFNHFRDNVIFMGISPSQGAIDLHKSLYGSLKTLDFLEWKTHEGEKITFHSTIVSRRISPKFKEIWDYVNRFDYSFDTYLDNITIMKWGENRRWNVYKTFDLK